MKNLKELTCDNSRKLLKGLPIALVLVYFSLAVVKIGLPGIQYDEILWGNAAHGGIDWTFITYKMGKIPVLLMPYIGAFKSYLYYPIFKLFGISPESIRLPMVFATALYLLLLFKTVRGYLDVKTAWLVLFLLSIDPSFISQTRVDCGPIVIQFCCKVLSLYLLVRLLDDLNFRYLAGIYLVLAVGLFNKLNFLWYINSLLFSAGIVYYRDFREKLEGRAKKDGYIFLFSNVAGYALLVGYYLLISRLYGLNEPLELLVSMEKLKDVFGYLKVMISGESFYVYALGDIRSKIPGIYFLFIILIFLTGSVMLLINRDAIDKGYRKSVLFFALLFITTLYQICITPQAGANWHLFSLYPFITVILTVSISTISRFAFTRDPLRIGALVALMAVITIYCMGMNARYVSAYDSPTKDINWSGAIYELIDYTKGSPYKFVSVDWGTQTQLITFDPVPGKYLEICYGVNSDDPGGAVKIISTMLEPGNNFAFIVHPGGDTSFDGPRFPIFDAARMLNRELRLIKTISDGGREIFRIYLPERRG